MRKIFAGAMAFSVIGAVILGGALAWRDSESFVGVSQVGNTSWDLDGPLCTEETVSFFGGDEVSDCHDFPGTLTDDVLLTSFLLGPSGDEVDIAYGSIENNSDSTFNIKLAGGDVVITSATPNSCAKSNFAGTVRGLGADHASPIAPGHHGGQFAAAIQVVPNANEACMGAFVGWQVTIFADTVSGGPQ
jgi:hypothetical protein